MTSPREAKRLCDESMTRSHRRRFVEKQMRDASREVVAIIVAGVALVALLALVAALKGYGVW